MAKKKVKPVNEGRQTGGRGKATSIAQETEQGMPQTLLLVCVAFGLGLLALLTYSNSFEAGFVLDNKLIFLSDTRIRALNWVNLNLIFSENYWWPSFASDLYRPLTTLSYLFNYAILGNGINPAGYHIVNFILHWCNTVMVFVLLRHISRSFNIALFAAAIFSVHPLGTESVTNVVGRADLLATGSILVAAIAYIRAIKSTGGERTGWLLVVALASTVGVFCKESAIMIVGFVGLYDMLYRWQKLKKDIILNFFANFWRLGWPAYLSLAPCLITLVWMRHILIQNSPVYGQIFIDNPIAGANFFQAQMTALKVIGLYLGLFLFPNDLSCDYSYNQIPLFLETSTWIDDVQALLGLVAVASLIVCAFAAWKRKPLLTFGLLFFFGMLLPTANMVIPIGSIMGERFLYLPMIGLALLVGWAVELVRVYLSGRIKGFGKDLVWAGWMLPVGVIYIFAFRAYARNEDWQNDLSLWTSAIKVCPNSFKVWKGLSNAVLYNEPNEEGLRKAIAVAEKGLYVLDHPGLPINRQDNTLFYDLGNYYRQLGDQLAARGAKDEAMVAWKRAIYILDRGRQVDTYVNQASRKTRLERGIKPEEITDVGNFKMHQSLGQTYLQMGDYKEAERSIRYMQQLNPMEPMGYALLGELYFRQEDLVNAAISLVETLIMDQNNQSAWTNLGVIYGKINPQPNAVLNVGGKPLLDQNNPMVQQHIQMASVRIFQTLVQSKRLREAEAVRANAIRVYRCPPEIFPQIPAPVSR